MEKNHKFSCFAKYEKQSQDAAGCSCTASWLIWNVKKLSEKQSFWRQSVIKALGYWSKSLTKKGSAADGFPEFPEIFRSAAFKKHLDNCFSILIINFSR